MGAEGDVCGQRVMCGGRGWEGDVWGERVGG